MIRTQIFSLILLLNPAGFTPGNVACQSTTDPQWIIRRPEEIVGYVVFDPETVRDRLPDFLRFVTVGELSDNGIGWASRHLSANPSHQAWGISFFEIVRADVFTIDGLSPEWPEDGAAALWLARVSLIGSEVQPLPGMPLLILEFWLPDSSYVTFMRERGYYATFGESALRRATSGNWTGTVTADGLQAHATCTPVGPVSGGANSRIRQQLIPPPSYSRGSIIRLDLSGHRIRDCAGSESWRITGTHPLVKGVFAGSSTFQFGYELAGSADER